MKERAPLVIIGGLDGSGKTTAAQHTARALSGEYPRKRIVVTDSTGMWRFQQGALVEHGAAQLEHHKPMTGASRLRAAVDLGAFTLGRRKLNARAVSDADLVISVRDPHRIDPALYAGIYGPSVLKKLPPHRRLALFGAFTRTSPADAVVHLELPFEDARDARVARNDVGMQPHETTQNLRIVADELPEMMAAYGSLFGAACITAAAMQPQTADVISASIEHYVAMGATIS